MNVRLLDIAHARSGDKGDTANVGLIAIEPGSNSPKLYSMPSTPHTR